MKKLKKIYDEKFDLILEVLNYHSKTPLGNVMREIRRQVNTEIKVDENVLNAISRFYKEDFEEFSLSQGWSSFDMLVYRRRELKNQNTYMANFFLAVLTGIIACIVYEYYPKIIRFMTGTYDGAIDNIKKLICTILFIVFIVFIPFLVMIVFKKAIMLIPPEIEFYDEHELNVIEEIISKRNVS